MKKPASDQNIRKFRISVLGMQTVRCEKCLADCSNVSGGEWVLDGLCPGCRNKKHRTPTG